VVNRNVVSTRKLIGLEMKYALYKCWISKQVD